MDLGPLAAAASNSPPVPSGVSKLRAPLVVGRGREFIICSICVLSPVVKTFFGSIFEQCVAVFRGVGEESAADVFLWHGRSLDFWLSMNGFIPQPIPQVLWEAQPSVGGRGGGHFDTECASRGSV